ncbi:hypothetical protein [Actinoplanes sp. NPDC049265]|uniref:hypothetical protein n=1 Tax=Actinoplanes sp. NPDC049265 TaxID=3363902 RepID=UPI0037134DD5
MSPTWRLSRWLLTVAAGRWPADISADLLREWQAELAVLRDSRFKMLMYAGSLVVAPTVDGPSWAQRTTTAATAAGATLLAAALSNAVHATAPLLLVPAGFLMALAARRARMSPTTAVSVMAPTLFTFLFLGNPVSVMPFMGLRDVAPAAIAWLLTMLLALRAPRPFIPVAAALSLLTATTAGALHAAHALNVSPWSAPLWFPLSLLPPSPHLPPLFLGNATAMTTPLLLSTIFVLSLSRPAPSAPVATPAFRTNPAGTPTFPTTPVATPTFRTNPAGTPAAFRTNPAGTPTFRTNPARTNPAGTTLATARTTLATARTVLTAARTVLTAALATARTTLATARTTHSPAARLIINLARSFSHRVRIHTTAITGAPGSPRRQATLGAAAAILAVVTCELTTLATADTTAMAHRILNHSAVFGFGFATHPAGQAAVALLAATLTLRLTEPAPE